MRIFTFGKREFLLMLLCILLFGIFAGLGFKGIRDIPISAEIKKLPIYCVETDKKQVALTFDAAWGNSNTDLLLSILEKNGAKATFFFTGQWVSKYPEDVLKIYAAGHEAANHSDSHSHIKNMSGEALFNDIAAANKKLKALTGVSPTLYRGPYGEYNNTLLSEVEKHKMFAVQWNLDSRDWQKKTPEEISGSILKNIKNGSIILFHNDLENTALALETLLPQLKREGYEFVTVSKLIYKENFRIKADGTQVKKVG